VADGEPGEIWVAGPGLADGYEGDDPAEAFTGEWLRTGDVGALRGGELYVFGRLTDSFRVGGVRVFAERAEQEMQGLLGEGVSFVVVPSRAGGAGPTVVVESPRPWEPARVAHARAAVAGQFDGAQVDLVFVPRGGIPRTTSGKPRRRECWQRYVGGADPR
jgi:acyl-CoA synthetase (AMP-forming)/AMP-acid ligase II